MYASLFIRKKDNRSDKIWYNMAGIIFFEVDNLPEYKLCHFMYF